MKRICKNTQRQLSTLDGDVNRLAETFPQLAEHLRNCPVCQAEVQALNRLRTQLQAQRLEIQNEAFWADFQDGLKQKLADSRKPGVLTRGLRRLQEFWAQLVFQPAYRWGVAILLLVGGLYLSYRTVSPSGEAGWDSPNFFYESYQEAAAGNPFETTLADPSEVLITTAEWSEGVQ